MRRLDFLLKKHFEHFLGLILGLRVIRVLRFLLMKDLKTFILHSINLSLFYFLSLVPFSWFCLAYLIMIGCNYWIVKVMISEQFSQLGLGIRS